MSSRPSETSDGPTGSRGRRRLRAIVIALLGLSLAGNVVFAVRYVSGQWPLQIALRLMAGSPDESQGFAYRMRQVAVDRLEPGELDGARPLPNELVISPGDYRAPGGTYSSREEGLYRFVVPGKTNEQRIVYEQDPFALMSALAWAVTHGTQDDGLTFHELRQEALTRKLTLTCGPLSEFARTLCEQAGLQARVVRVVTLDEHNGYDDGHVLLELRVRDLNRWVVFDLDNNASFLRGGVSPSAAHSGPTPLSVVEFVEAVRQDELLAVRLSGDTRLDVQGFKGNGFDWTFFGEMVQADLRSWYKRVAQVALIPANGKYYFCDEAAREGLASEGSRFEYMAKKDFMAKFYPEQ